MITRDRIERDLRRAGLGPGQAVLVHSSLKSIGRVQGGADAVVDALQNVLTRSGTLIMPTFTYSLPMWGISPFDPKSSPSRTGLVTETLRRRPDAVRSFHPTHSFVAWGAGAEQAMRDHLDPLGRRSPIGWLVKNDGWILQIGTNHNTNSTLHYCEVLAGVPYLGVVFTLNRSTEVARAVIDGKVEEVIISEVPGCSQGFLQIEPFLAERGLVRKVLVGHAQTLLTRIRPFVDEVVALLREHPALLLCTNPGCGICPRRRRVVLADPEKFLVSLVDLFIAGQPAVDTVPWSVRAGILAHARVLCERVISRLREIGGHAAATSEEAVRQWLAGQGVRVKESPLDGKVLSQFDATASVIRINLGAIQRLATRFSSISSTSYLGLLRDLTPGQLRELALAHEAFHVALARLGIEPPVELTRRARLLVEEVAARLFADRICSLPCPALLIDVWMMYAAET